jgi:uncharacterized membrane protein YkoI
MRRRTLFLTLAAASLCPAILFAGGPAEEAGDSALARTALERGDIRPLADILAAVEARYEGRVIATGLQCRAGRWIYEFKLLPPTGRLFKVRVDASTGRLIETDGPALERP